MKKATFFLTIPILALGGMFGCSSGQPSGLRDAGHDVATIPDTDSATPGSVDSAIDLSRGPDLAIDLLRGPEVGTDLAVERSADLGGDLASDLSVDLPGDLAVDLSLAKPDGGSDTFVPVGAWPTKPVSFWVQAQITRTSLPNYCGAFPGGLCPNEGTDAFLVRTEPGQTIVLGARGNAYRVSVVLDSEGYWVTQACPSPASATFPWSGSDRKDLCFSVGENGFGGDTNASYHSGYRYGSLRFRLTEATLEGEGLARVDFQLGDTISTWSGTARLAGVIDHQAPILGVVRFGGSISDTGSTVTSTVLPLCATEPLPGDTTAWLLTGAGVKIPLEPIRTVFASDLIVGFQPPLNWATPGTSYTLGMGGFVDLAGNRGTPSLTFTYAQISSDPDGGVDSAVARD